jgi:regulator of nucleoside diphosphate kinase
MTKHRILITQSDMSRLNRLLESALSFFRRDRPYLETLEEELSRAKVVSAEEMPASVVVLNSRVRVRDLRTGQQAVYELVFPRDANVGEERLSVLAPIGTAILGRRVGDIVECRAPAGGRRLKLEGIEEVKAPISFESAA